jgi:hypothetical protein
MFHPSFPVYKATLQSWAVFTKIAFCSTQCVVQRDHCYFIKFSPGAAHSPKAAELRDTKYSDIYHVVT